MYSYVPTNNFIYLYIILSWAGHRSPTNLAPPHQGSGDVLYPSNGKSLEIQFTVKYHMVHSEY